MDLLCSYALGMGCIWCNNGRYNFIIGYSVNVLMWQQSVKYDSNVCFVDIIKSSNYMYVL